MRDTIDIVQCELDMCKDLLREVLPYIQYLSDEVPVWSVGKIDNLVDEIETAILEDMT